VRVGRGELPPGQRGAADRVELEAQQLEPRMHVLQQVRRAAAPQLREGGRPPLPLPCLRRGCGTRRVEERLAAPGADVVVDAIGIYELPTVAAVQTAEAATAFVRRDIEHRHSLVAVAAAHAACAAERPSISNGCLSRVLDSTPSQTRVQNGLHRVEGCV
jgi:hypothetical protein